MDKLVEPDSCRDPMTPLRWTSKSLRRLADQLRAQGHLASATLVGRLLHEADYSLQANSKTLEGEQHPDCDAQLQHIHDTVATFLAAGTPVVSVDCKNRELVGRYRTTARSTDLPATRRRSRSTISSARPARRSPTASTSWAPTLVCRWAPTTRLPRSP